MSPGDRDGRDAVVTASAYVILQEQFVFAVGFPHHRRDHLGVARLGGHCEPGETAWGCAAREVREESSLTIRALQPPTTYWLAPGQHVSAMTAAPWPGEPGEAAPPLFVGWRREGAARHLSPTYLAWGEGTPVPAAETQGLLLLRPRHILRLARERLTLGALLQDGGRTVLRAPLPPDARLEPLTQLRALAILLERHPDLLPPDVST
ncbi:MAG TPA: NUDIX domain-containing protein [Chloroflexota bacterium]|nr:NUDIX domain-containing protein [Chloroflexota bacterium]